MLTYGNKNVRVFTNGLCFTVMKINYLSSCKMMLSNLEEHRRVQESARWK